MKHRDILLAALALLIAWEIISLILNRDILPAPTAVLAAFVVQLPRSLGWHFLVSAWRVVASIALSVLLATPAGLALGQYPRVNRFMAPVVYLTYPIPKIVLLPIVILFLGIGDASKNCCTPSVRSARADARSYVSSTYPQRFPRSSRRFA